MGESARTATGTSYCQLMELIVHQASKGQFTGLSSDKGLFVVSVAVLTSCEGVGDTALCWLVVRAWVILRCAD